MSNQVYMLARPLSADETNEIVDRKGGMRLNNAMKSSIVKKAMAHAFDKRYAAILKEDQALCKTFWLHKFGAAKLKHALALDEPFVYICKDAYDHALPHGILLGWNVGGQHVQLHCQLPIPRSIGSASGKFFVIKDEKLIARCREWQEDAQELEKERTKVQTTLDAMLQNIGTYTSLQKNWAEGSRFYRHLPKEFPYRHQVPATLVSELNKSLGI